MPKKKYIKIKDSDPNYDIPDEIKPDETEVDESENEFYNKKYMVILLTNLRNEAIRLRKKQNSYWDSYGDNYKLEEIPLFILKNKEEIAGVVKDAPWILSAKSNEWEDNFILYYGVLVRFIKVSQYAITSYEKSLNKEQKQ